MKTLRNGAFDLIHLDHDLEGDLTGEDVAEKIRLVCPETPVIIHSENPSGASKIARILPDAIKVPISQFFEDTSKISQLKALVSDSGLESAECVIHLLR
jgi:hypothetical protein